MKTIYFLVAVDLETGTKHIDDDMAASLPYPHLALDNETLEWVEETPEEYAKALAVLNSSHWGKE
jgi:hypothetical protein